MRLLPNIHHIGRGESMRCIQFKKNRVCFRAILLVLICISLLSLFSNIGNGFILENAQASDINHGLMSSRSAGKVHQNPPLVEVCFQQASFYQDTQRLLSYKNNSSMAIFNGSVYGPFFRTTASLISLSGQIPVSKIKYFLIAPHCPNAPPYILIWNCLNHSTKIIRSTHNYESISK